MSILKDLDREVRRAMDADKELYQHSHAKLVREMQQAYLVTDVSVSTASTLLSYAESVKFNFESENFVLKLYQIFGK
jgi:hypothetical protein